MIALQSLKLVHRVASKNQPPALTQYFQHRPELGRAVRKPCVKYKYKTARTKNSFLHRSVYMYNNLPDHLRILNKKQFNKQIKIFIRMNYELKNIPKIPS